MAHGPAGHLLVTLLLHATAAAGTTGTIAATQDDQTMSAAGTSTVAGSIAATQDDQTMSAAGNVTVPGTIAATQDDQTMSAAGTHPAVGTMAATQADQTMSAAGSSYGGTYPATVSGRKLLDQNSASIPIKSFSSWAWAQNGTDAEITDHLEFVAGLGFNAVTLWPCGGYYGVDWERWENNAGASYFTGTPLASSFGAAWASVDWAMTEASRLGLTVLFSLYSGYNMPPRQGIGDQLITNTNTNAYDYGYAVATRYAAYDNIVWHYGADEDFDWGATLATRIDNLFHGLVDGDTAAGRTRLQIAEPTNGRTGYDQFISQEGNGTTGYGWLNLSTNIVYNGGGTAGDINSVEGFDAVYTESGATSLPVWDCEEPYVDGGAFDFDSGDDGQQHRERSLSTVIRGGIGFNFGHAAGWGAKDLTNYVVTSEDWTDVYTNSIVLGMEHINAMVDLIQGTSWAPTDSFVTTGTGSGDTKAAAGTDGTKAVAYFPSNRTVAVDTTIISGTGNVRLRWWNPQDGTFTSITTSEAQQTGRSVTIPAAHADTTRDWLLYVDSATGTTGTITATQDDQTMTAAGTSTIAGTIAATQADQTMAASGTSTVAGTIAATQDDQTMAAAGYPTTTGTIGATQDDQTMSAAGTSTVAGTIAATQDDQTMSANGTYGSNVLAAVQDDQTMSATGVVPAVGAMASSQDDQTMAAAGTITVEGTIAATQADQTMVATGAGTTLGTITAVQDDQTMDASGTHPTIGTIDVTQDDQTMEAHEAGPDWEIDADISGPLDDDTIIQGSRR